MFHNPTHIKPPAIAAGLGLASALWIGCTEPPASPPPPRPVVTRVVQPPPTSIQRAFSGITQAETNSSLSFLIGGRIERLQARVGMRVQRGETIAELDPTDYRLQLEQAQAQVRSAEAQRRSSQAQLASVNAQLIKAQEDFKRISVLYEKDSVGKAQYDGVVAALEAAKASTHAAHAAIEAAAASVESAGKSSELAQQQLDHAVLSAPGEGTIGEVPLEVNQVIQAGATVATLISQDHMQVEIGVPEALIEQISLGLRGVLRLDSPTESGFPCAVSKIGVVASQTATYPVTLKLDAADSRLRPGMTGDVTLDFPTPPDRRLPVVPAVAVCGIQNERFVWIFDAATSSVKKRSVTTGDLLSEGVQIKKGLNPGETMVVRGANRLTEGMAVHALSETGK